MIITAPQNIRPAQTYHLDQRHSKELFDKRGLDPKWCEVNCRSVSAEKASELLGYKAQSDGIWLEGTNFQGQFKPDKPWKSSEDKKVPKYRTGTGEYDVMLPIHPDNPNYWNDLEALKKLCYQINGHPCLLATEGFFKAIYGCANDIPTIALLGVEMGLTSASNDPQGKRYLVPTLETLVNAGFGFIIPFDADCVTNKNVVEAQRKLAYQLIKFKVPVYIATGLWTVDQGKGMDDYIQANGADSFRREILGKVVDFETWENQFRKDYEGNKRLSESFFASRLIEKYRALLAWHVGNKAWYRYEAENKSGIWGGIPVEEALDIVITELRTVTEHFSYRFAMGVLSLVKSGLRINKWEVCSGYVCLEDCVLEVSTLKTYPHQPGYRMFSQLPFKWADRSVGCEPIKQWLLEVCGGREDWVQVIRAGINATITERGNLQRFIEIVGASGTGKGTLLRLIQRLLGKENYAVTDLKQLEKNRFETAVFYGKKAIFITDSERYAGDVSNLKKITGYDDLRYEKKGVQQTEPFKYNGVVWVAANEAMQSTDYTNAFPRRRLSISFNRVIPPNKRRDMEKEFEPYLPGLLSWVLEMDEEEVKAYFVDTNNKVPSLAAYSKEILTETNPLANWADECLYHDPNIETGIGDKNQDPAYFLYPNYVAWAVNNGQGAMSKQRFSSILLNLLNSQLGINAVKRKTNKGRFITGIGIRHAGHNFPLLISEDSDNIQQNNNDFVTTPVATENTDSDGFDDSDNSLTKTSKLDNTNQNQKNENNNTEKNAPPPSSQSSTSSLPTVPSQRGHAVMTTDNNKQTVTEQLTQAWNNPTQLGNLVLSLSEIELGAAVINYTPQQIKHIKDAANSVWMPGLNRDADYNGERVEIFQAGRGRDIKVRTNNGSFIKVKRGSLRPWLGIDPVEPIQGF